jgi:hypothetical protein
MILLVSLAGRVLECLTDLLPLRNRGSNNDVPPYDAFGRLLLAKHTMGRALASNSAVIVPLDPGIIFDLLKLVIFIDVPRCNCLRWHLLSFLLSFQPCDLQ